MVEPRRAYVTLAIFAFSFAFVWWLAGNRLVMTNDEGIFFAHAARIAEGEVLYRDLFGLTGPASFWLLAIVFKIAGVSLASAHLILTAEIALLTTLVFFVAREMADTAMAVAVSAIFLILNAADPAMMTNNHRWDADAYAIAGIVAIWRGRTFLGGLLLALSVWATPIFALTAIASVVAALIIGKSPWRIIAGGATGAVAGVLALALTGSLGAFIQSLLWVKSNYSDVNRMPYGSLFGGYASFFEGSSGGMEWGMRAFILAGVALPAWMPPLCGLLMIRDHDRDRLYFLVCGLSMIAAVSPRYDVGHLVFAAPLFYPIAASFVRRARWTIVPVGALALLFLFSAVVQRVGTELVETPFGTVRTDATSAATVRWLMANIKPGERLFVYPYPPIAYLLTQSKNVSRFSYLHPGLFTEADERAATEDMIRNPPSKVLYMNIPREEYLRMWPASDPERLQLPFLHNFVVTNFEPGAKYQRLELYTPRVAASSGVRKSGL